MSDIDLRRTGPRLRRLALATVIGAALSIGITLLLPTRDHYPYWDCGFTHPSQGHVVTGGDPVLMLAGAIVFAVIANALLGYKR